MEWNDYVEEAKLLILQLRYARIEIAKLAMKACEIKWGGDRKWQDQSKVKSLTNFASAIGVSYKTLHTYVLITEKVYYKLTKKQRDNFNYTAGRATLLGLKEGINKKEVQEKYTRQEKMNPRKRVILDILQRTKRFNEFMKDYSKLEVDYKDMLQEISGYCDSISKNIKKVI